MSLRHLRIYILYSAPVWMLVNLVDSISKSSSISERKLPKLSNFFIVIRQPVKASLSATMLIIQLRKRRLSSFFMWIFIFLKRLGSAKTKFSIYMAKVRLLCSGWMSSYPRQLIIILECNRNVYCARASSEYNLSKDSKLAKSYGSR
jgi:hypothetical protein